MFGQRKLIALVAVIVLVAGFAGALIAQGLGSEGSLRAGAGARNTGVAEASSLLGFAPSLAYDNSQPAGITVGGQGMVKAEPDLAYVSAGVQTKGATAQEAQQQNATLMNAVLAKLQGMGYGNKELRTSGLSVHPVYDRSGTTPTGYQANNQVVVTVNDITQAGAVYDAVVAAGANLAGGIRFGFKDDAPLRQQALREAVKAARIKADAIATEMGVTITGVDAVIEESAGGPPMPMDVARLSAAAASEATPVQPGELTITASVRMVFRY